jgi:hypothetical protein
LKTACILALLRLSVLHSVAKDGQYPVLHSFVEAHCTDCHDADTKKGGLDLTALKLDAAGFEEWVKVHDRVRAGEMPPKKKPQPAARELDAAMASLSKQLVAMDSAREQRDGRSRLRRLNRVEFENTLRDLLGLPALKVKDSLPEDGKSHGFDRLAGALDMSFVHMESYLAAVDKALNEALCPFPERPPVFKYRAYLTENNRKDGKECEGSVGLAIGNKTAIGLIDMKRDEKLVADTAHHLTDGEPKANAIGMFRHEDADFRWTMTAIEPVVSGWHRLRVSGYSFGWDGKEVVPTERHGALGWGVFAKGEHYGTVDLPPNKPAERVITAWIERGGGMMHGTDDFLRIIAASCENFRDYAFGKNKDVVGPMSPAPGVAVEWVEIEGPIYDQWPPASHRALFGDLPVKEWTKDSVVPKPAQQTWPRGNPYSMPKDIYGERGDKRPVVYVESKEPAKDAERLLRTFLRRALRRPVTDPVVADYLSQVTTRLAAGAAFQDAMIAVYREVLTSPEFMLLREPVGRLDDHALATRLSYFLWSSLPDAELESLADKHQLSKPATLRAQTERMLKDKRAERFVENFTGQWLALRELNANQPDRKLYPEFMPWLSDAMLMESRAFFAELLKLNLGVKHFVQSDFAMLNEPLARLYGIEGVRGWDIRRVALPADSTRGGFLTQAAVLKTTANGTTTSPVKRGAFVMDKILGIVPTPPPPGTGAIEPDVRGATTIREQLAKHSTNATCAGCHAKMDPYGFALESFDVVGEWRGQYRAVGGAGRDEDRKLVNGRRIEYHASLPVDCTGQLPDGRPFKDVNELRAMLAADPERLARAFVSQLVTYATGAEISFADRAAVTDILIKTKASHYGLRSLIHEVIQSELFCTK